MKNNHGGRREGAGRPPTGQPRKVVMSITLAPHIREAAAKVAKARRQSLSAFVEEVLWYRLMETDVFSSK